MVTKGKFGNAYSFQTHDLVNSDLQCGHDELVLDVQSLVRWLRTTGPVCTLFLCAHEPEQPPDQYRLDHLAWRGVPANHLARTSPSGGFCALARTHSNDTFPR